MHDALKRLIAAGPALACIVNLGCGAPADRGGTLIVGLSADPDSWNPYTTRDASTASLLELLYPRLLRETGAGPGAGFRPWLAESWSFSEDRLTLSFDLRGDARWSDGTAVTCDDVSFTWRAQISDDLGWQGRQYKRRIRAVECPEPHRAVFRFTEAYPDQLLDANDNAIVPGSYAEVPLGDWRATPWHDRAVTCGPFRLASVTPGQEAVLERDPLWWDAGTVRPDRVVLRVYGDAVTVVERFLDGEVDVVPRVPARQVPAIENREGHRVVRRPSMTYTFVAWNMLEPGAYMSDRRLRGCAAGDCAESVADILRLRKERPHPVLSDPLVRRAFDHAIDRRDLIEGLWGGWARELHTPIVSSLWAHEEIAGRAFDPARARALLEQAGWIDTDGDGVRERAGRRLSLRILVYASNASWADAAGRIAEGLRLVGAEAAPEPVPRGEFVRRAWDKDFDAVISAWRAGTRVEPQLLFHTRAALDRGNNLGAWSTPLSDALLDRGASATRREQAAGAWSEWQRAFHAEAPYSILAEHVDPVGLSARVRGATPTTLNPFDDLQLWWIAPAGAVAER